MLKVHTIKKQLYSRLLQRTLDSRGDIKKRNRNWAIRASWPCTGKNKL